MKHLTPITLPWRWFKKIQNVGISQKIHPLNIYFFIPYIYIPLDLFALFSNIYIYIYIFVCIYIYIYIYIYIFVCVYIYIYICVCIYIYIFVCVYIYIYICVCVYIYIYIYICTSHSKSINIVKEKYKLYGCVHKKEKKKNSISMYKHTHTHTYTHTHFCAYRTMHVYAQYCNFAQIQKQYLQSTSCTKLQMHT